MDDKLLMYFVHFIGHLVVYSLVLWQMVLGFYLLIKWVNKNWKIKKTFSVQSPSESKTQTIQPVINIDGSSIGEGIAKKNKDMGAVEVDFKKEIFVDEVKEKNITSDVEKGKVKTQKDKLKKLRGK